MALSFETILRKKHQKLNFSNPHYHPDPLAQTPGDLLNTYVELLRRAQQLLGDVYNPSDEVLREYEGIAQAMLALYINELWIGESPPSSNVDTKEIATILVENKDNPHDIITQKLAESQVREPERLAQKLNNILLASQHLFGRSFHQFRSCTLSLELVCEVHRLIGQADVIPDAGQFRTVQVGPAGSSVVYALSKNIESRLKCLVNFVNEQQHFIAQEVDLASKVEKMVCLGSLFFSEFLLIHPFINGNGRIARLLLNFIMKDTCIIPFSMFLTSRTEYISVLEARNGGLKPPYDLTFYVLHCALKTLSKFMFLLAD